MVLTAGCGCFDSGILNVSDINILFTDTNSGYFLRDADIVLTGRNLNLIAEAIGLSFAATERERQNVEITALLNTLGMALAVSHPVSYGSFNVQ